MKAGGAKDARKVDARMPHDAKRYPAEVPARAVLPGEAGPFGWVERVVWTDRMLETLRRGGPEGGRWYWLHDEVFAEKTLRAAFARVSRNGGAPGRGRDDGRGVREPSRRGDHAIAKCLEGRNVSAAVASKGMDLEAGDGIASSVG